MLKCAQLKVVSLKPLVNAESLIKHKRSDKCGRAIPLVLHQLGECLMLWCELMNAIGSYAKARWIFAGHDGAMRWKRDGNAGHRVIESNAVVKQGVDGWGAMCSGLGNLYLAQAEDAESRLPVFNIGREMTTDMLRSQNVLLADHTFDKVRAIFPMTLGIRRR